ncbi:MAG: hypothetical protein V4623_09315 [Pseudomonadota bacterium]
MDITKIMDVNANQAAALSMTCALASAACTRNHPRIELGGIDYFRFGVGISGIFSSFAAALLTQEQAERHAFFLPLAAGAVLAFASLRSMKQRLEQQDIAAVDERANVLDTGLTLAEIGQPIHPIHACSRRPEASLVARQL